MTSSRRIDHAALNEARGRVDAVAGYRVIYEALGLDQAYVEDIPARRRSTRKPEVIL